MKTWWNNLSEREHWIMGGGAGLIIFLLLYTLVWQPFHKELQQLRQSVAQQLTELAWMRQAAQQVKRLSSAPVNSTQPPQQKSDGRSLLTLVDQTARAAGLSTAIKRVEPQGNDEVRILLEQADFDKLIRWLGSLQRNYGVQVDNAIVERQSDQGQINARLILQRTVS